MIWGYPYFWKDPDIPWQVLNPPPRLLIDCRHLVGKMAHLLLILLITKHQPVPEFAVTLLFGGVSFFSPSKAQPKGAVTLKGSDWRTVR